MQHVAWSLTMFEARRGEKGGELKGPIAYIFLGTILLAPVLGFFKWVLTPGYHGLFFFISTLFVDIGAALIGLPLCAPASFGWEGVCSSNLKQLDTISIFLSFAWWGSLAGILIIIFLNRKLPIGPYPYQIDKLKASGKKGDEKGEPLHCGDTIYPSFEDACAAFLCDPIEVRKFMRSQNVTALEAIQSVMITKV